MINTKNVLISLSKNSSKFNLLKNLPKNNFMTFLPSTKLNFNMQNIQNSNSLNNFFSLQSKNFSFDEFNDMRRNNNQTQNRGGEQGKRIYVGNLPWSIDTEEYINFFEQFGEVSRDGTFICNDGMGRSKGFGFVEFTRTEDAMAIVESEDSIEMSGRTLKINMANRQKERPQRNSPRLNRESNGQQSESNTLFMGNLSFDNKEHDIQEFFNDFGSTSVRMGFKDNGLNKGFCHVQFEDVEKAKSAFENMNGKELSGRGVRLDFAAPRKE